MIGDIVSVDAATRTIMVESEDGEEHSARLTDDTQIWLDKSASAAKNEVGSPADCQEGRRCEIKYVYDGGTRTERAEWIKIQVE